MKLILQIALGVSLGIVLGGTLLHLYTGAFNEQLIAAVLKQSVVQTTPLPPKANIDELLAGNAPTVINPPVAPNPPAPAQQLSFPPTPIAKIDIAGKNPTTEVIDPYSEEQKEKVAKFKAYYKKSEKCLSAHNDDHNTLVACGNEYIRAKAKFEELYQQEKLKN